MKGDISASMCSSSLAQKHCSFIIFQILLYVEDSEKLPCSWNICGYWGHVYVVYVWITFRRWVGDASKLDKNIHVAWFLNFYMSKYIMNYELGEYIDDGY